MTVLRRFVADRRRSLLGWSVGAVLLVAMTVAFYPTIRDQPSIEDVARNLPEAIKATFGIDDAVPLSSPEGYLHGRMFSLTMPLALVIFGIGVGARAIGGSEEEGHLELLLAQPVRRRRIVVERFGAVTVLVVAVGAVFTASLFALAPLFGAMAGVPVPWVAAACAGAVLLGLMHASIAFAVGAAVGTRSAALGAATSVAVAGYLLQGLLAASGASAAARMVSPWQWYLRRNMLVDGPDAVAFLLPLAVSVVAMLASIGVFVRRDLR